MALAGFLPGVLVGGVITILGLILLSPVPNLPPPARDNSPGDVTIQLSQSFLNAVASQKLNGTGIPVPGGSVPLEGVKAQPQSGDQLVVTGNAELPLSSAPVVVDLQPCVSSQGKPAFMVTQVKVGDMQITNQVGPSIQEMINSAFKDFSLSIPNEHLARVQTTPNAMILIYASGSGPGQPACHGI